MYNPATEQMLHRHGDEWYQMEPVDTDRAKSDDHDVERRLVRGRRVFRCPDCHDEVCIDVPSEG